MIRPIKSTTLPAISSDACKVAVSTIIETDPLSSTLVPGGIRSSSLILTAATDPTEAGPVLKCTISPRAKILVPPFESATAAGVVAEGSVDSADDSVSTATDDMCRRLLSTESVLEGKRARPGAIVPKARAGVLWPTRAL